MLRYVSFLCILGMEMVVHGGQIHFRFGDDAAQRSSRVALLGK